MRRNRVKQLLRDGRPVIGTAMPFVGPDVVEYMGLLGYDFFFIDGEHGGIGPETAAGLVRAANVVGIEPVLRVPHNEPGVIMSYLETGVSTIVVPHCNTADEVSNAVHAVKYPPAGVRGAGSASRAANYGLTQGAAEYFAAANEETMVLPMIEEARAVDNLDAILEVEGLEAVFIGPGDLALSMGLPGQLAHPAVRERVDYVIDKARARGLAVGTIGRDVETTRDLLNRGVYFILSSASTLLVSSCRGFLTAVRQ